MGVIGPDGEHEYADFRLSPDETRLAASLVDPKLSVPDIWLTDLVRGGTSGSPSVRQLVNASAVWSPEGERILFRTNRKGLIELYQKAASAGGNDEPFLLEKPAREGGKASPRWFRQTGLQTDSTLQSRLVNRPTFGSCP